MLLSVIVPAYNEEKIIRRTLGRIQDALCENARDGFSWELIVCDNNSSDRTAEVAARAGARLVFEPVNQISRARNQGASSAQGDWLLFIDADTYPPPGLIAELMKFIRSGDVIGCGSTIQVEGGPSWDRWNVQGHNIEMRLFKTCMGMFVASEAEAFRAIGGFSSDLYAFEDLDFVNRLKVYGRRRGKRFAVLHRHPVVTSGRKGELYRRWVMTQSSLTALWYLITKRKIQDTDSLPFWYDGRRSGDTEPARFSATSVNKLPRL